MYAQNEARTGKSGSYNYFFRLIGLILCIGAAVSVALTILNLIDLGIELSSRVILIAVVVDIALVIFPLWMFSSGRCDRNNFARFGCFALAGLMLFLNIFISSYLSATTDFLEETYTGSGSSIASQGIIDYTVVAQRTAGVELSEKNTVRAGIQSTDPCKTEAEDETKKLTAASFEEYDNLATLISATEGDMLDIAVVQKAMLVAYAEYFPDSYDKLEVIATFKAGSDKAQTNTTAKVDVTKPFSIYVSGIDVFGDIDQVARSDANILILIDPEHYKVLLINTPRDYYVQLHGTTGYKDKLTHAGVYGIEMSEQTIEDIYGLDIDYHVRINFDTIVNLVDAMGGIVVDNPVAFANWGTGYKAGEIYLTGDYALMYARSREGLKGGDNDRGENQQRVIEAIIKRITKPSVVIHYRDILTALSGTFRSNIPPKVITQLFSRQISLGGDWTIEKMAARGRTEYRPTYSMGEKELDVMIPDESSLVEIREAISAFMRGED